jgi:hypothetical protein
MRGGEVEPHVRLDDVLLDPVALVVQQAEHVLRGRLALVGGAEIPVGRHVVVLRHAAAGRIHVAEIGLRARVAGERERPQDRRGGVEVLVVVGGDPGT